MSTRYLSNALVALLGGLVVVMSLTLATVAAAWVGFGVAIGVVAISLLVQLDADRGLAQRGMDAALVAVGAAMIVTSLVLGASTVTWVMFALALGYVALAFAGMTLHEVTGWRSQHGLGELHWLDRAPAEHRSTRRDHIAA